MPAVFANVYVEGLDQTAKAFAKFGSDVAKIVPDRVRAATFVVQGEIKKQASGGTVGGALTPTRGPGRASGKLAQSFTTAFAFEGNLISGQTFFGRVGSNLPYAAIHEFGGTVKAKKKWLTIPLTYEASRRPAPLWPALQFIQARGKSPVLIDDATGIAQFVLKRSVEIPARVYVSKSVKLAAPRVNKLIESGIDIAVKKLDGGT